MAADTEAKPIVLDIGSLQCRFGFADDNAATELKKAAEIEDLLGPVADQNDNYIGDEVQKELTEIASRWPIERGVVTNWDDMEKIWRNIFTKLRVAPEKHPVLLMDAPYNPWANREKMAQIMFETFNVPAMYITVTSLMALFSRGITNGIALECGDGVTTVMPVYEGLPLAGTTIRLDLAGRDITDYLTKVLAERGFSFTTATERDIVRDIKEKLCYVALDFEQEETQTADGSNSLEESYELPDGRVVTLGSERFRCPEALFQPSSFDMGQSGIQEILHKSIMSIDEDVREDEFKNMNIVVSGGSTFFPGFADRIKKVITDLAPNTGGSVNVTAFPERNQSAWIGGAVMASLDNFQSIWITRKDYDESGPNVTHIGALADREVA